MRWGALLRRAPPRRGSARAKTSSRRRRARRWRHCTRLACGAAAAPRRGGEARGRSSEKAPAIAAGGTAPSKPPPARRAVPAAADATTRSPSNSAFSRRTAGRPRCRRGSPSPGSESGATPERPGSARRPKRLVVDLGQPWNHLQRIGRSDVLPVANPHPARQSFAPTSTAPAPAGHGNPAASNGARRELSDAAVDRVRCGDVVVPQEQSQRSTVNTSVEARVRTQCIQLRSENKRISCSIYRI